MRPLTRPPNRLRRGRGACAVGLTVAWAALAAMAATGCGSTKLESPATPRDGKTVFVAAGCGGCHTFAAAGADGKSGPNLDALRPRAAAVEAQVRDGGGGMPAYGKRLSAAEIAAVARFVESAAGR